MEKMKLFYKNKKVLVTGATGFKGAWLCAWLLKLGAKVYGTGYNPNQNKSLFYKLSLQKKINLKIFDIRDYKKPLLTFEVNCLGTLNILEVTKNFKFIKSLVSVTSDKCYENKGWTRGYKENDVLGGVDPYSASKASSELIIRAYRESFFNGKENRGVSSARAGNVIGGGDWSSKRLIPDCIRALRKGSPINLRNPNFNRPWQFVMAVSYTHLTLPTKRIV